MRINLIAQKIVVIIYDTIFEKNQLVDERNLRNNLTNGLWGIVSMLENKSINFKIKYNRLFVLRKIKTSKENRS